MNDVLVPCIHGRLRSGAAAGLFLALVATGCVGPGRQGADSAPVLTHGISAGLDEQHAVVLWARAERTGHIKFRWWTAGVDRSGSGRQGSGQVTVDSETDFTGKLRVTGLEPGAEYLYTGNYFDPVSQISSKTVTGRFVAPPAADAARPVTFAWGSDIAGQNICRDTETGFPILAAIADLAPDVFIGTGDMIYADGRCRAINRYGDPQLPGPRRRAVDLEGYRAYWRYVRADPGFQQLLARSLFLPVWDDHEVANNFGPLHDVRARPPYRPGVHLLAIGLRAFFDYNPVLPAAITPQRIYRRVRWGQHAEFFLLDTRQYRDHNYANDSDEYPKTMLGREQAIWLKNGLARSHATWKIIVSSVPLSIPTAFTPGRQPDAWADGDRSGGFERELIDIVHYAYAHKVSNILWLTGDVHMGAMLRYRPIPENAQYVFHEAISGPLHARVFGTRNVDPTLGPELLYLHAPEDFLQIKSYRDVRKWWNFGFGRIDQAGRLSLSLRDVDGEIIYGLELSPVPQ